MTDGPEQLSRAGFAEGNAEIWREFLDREIPLLYGMFMNRWPNPTLAEELVQKTVFDAVRGCGSYNISKGSPEEWIFGIARNNIRLETRRRASRPSVNGETSRYLELIDSKPLPDEVLERKETSVIVHSALDRLESKEQAVLKAKYIEGLCARDIARQMSITEKAVHNLLYRARISLRQELKKRRLRTRTDKNYETRR
ncbi:MAG: sigma-70 family RNA polymerase sigma factor [Sedimentisphaerales bacterium]